MSTLKKNILVFVGENISSGTQTKEALLVNPFVSAKSVSPTDQKSLPDPKWEIISYQVVFVVNGTEASPYYCYGFAIY